MNIAERYIKKDASRIEKPQLSPVVVELGEATRQVVWELAGLKRSETDPVPDGLHTKGADPAPISFKVGGTVYEAIWKSNTKDGTTLRHINLSSGDKRLVVHYGTTEDGSSGEGGSIIFNDGGKRLVDSESAIKGAVSFLGEIFPHLPAGKIPILGETNKILFQKPKAA